MDNKQYGVFLGRFQPFHQGHQHIIDKIIEDGLEPILLLGSAQESGTINNPYTVHQRATMIRFIYPDSKIGAINDYDCNDKWLEALILYVKHLTATHIKSSTIYLHEKLEDKANFTFRGVDYTDESYCKIYEVVGLHTKTLALSDIPIRAKAIREDLEKNKKYLHKDVYNYIKELNEKSRDS